GHDQRNERCFRGTRDSAGYQPQNRRSTLAGVRSADRACRTHEITTSNELRHSSSLAVPPWGLLVFMPCPSWHNHCGASLRHSSSLAVPPWGLLVFMPCPSWHNHCGASLRHSSSLAVPPWGLLVFMP